MSRIGVLALGVCTLAMAACGPQPAKTDAAAPSPTASAPQTSTAPTAPTTGPAVTGAPGASFDTAMQAQIGAPIAGVMPKPPAAQFYQFTFGGKVRDMVAIKLDAKGSTLRPYFRLYDANRNQVREISNNNIGAAAEAQFAIEAGQTLWVTVQPSSSDGPYQLTLTPQNAFDTFEPNEDILAAKPVAFPVALEGNVMFNDDSDFYRITGNANAKEVTVTLENLGTTLRPRVKIFNANKSSRNDKVDSTAGANLTFKQEVTPGEDFYVQVLGAGSAGAYKLTVR